MELLMRIKAILRRTVTVKNNGAKAAQDQIGEENAICFQDLVLDLDRKSVLRGEEHIALTYTEFRILELLVTHRKKIYSLENIYQSIWEDEVVADSAIMVHIKNLRKKIGDNSRDPKYIKTAWGRGYYVD